MRNSPTPAAYVLGVLVVLALVLLSTPGGATGARWVSQRGAEVPGLAPGRTGFDLAAGEATATLTNASGTGLAYRPVQVSLVDPRHGPVASPVGMSFTYRTGADCTSPGLPARWASGPASGERGTVPLHAVGEPSAPLHRDGTAELCLVVSTDAAAEEALRPLNGRELQVVTDVAAAPAAGGSPPAHRDWVARYVVDVPATAGPPSTVQLTSRCGSASGKAVTVGWAWSGQGPQAHRWEVLAHRGPGAPVPLLTVGGSAGEAILSRESFRSAFPASNGNGTYRIVVRALSAAGAPLAEAVTPQTVTVTGANVECSGAGR